MNTFSVDTINKWNDDTLQVLYNNFYKALVLYASNILGTTEGAEDIVQDAFTQTWLKRPSFASTAQIKVYLYTTTHNLCVSLLRQKGRKGNTVRLQSLSEEVMALTDNGEEDFFTPEIYRHLMLLINSLPTRQREVFLLAMEGKKNHEIAEQLHISQNTVKVLKGRALQKLRQETSEKDYLFLLFSLFL